MERPADITLADFWGIEKVMPSMDDDKGTSCVLIHSPRGKALFDTVLENVKTETADLNFVTRANPAIFKSAPENKNRNKFFVKIGKNENFEKTVIKCLSEPFYKKSIRFARRQCGKVIRNFKK